MYLATFNQYRLNMLFVIIGQSSNTLFAYLGIWVLFERFGHLDGWTFAEVALCFGITMTSFAATEFFARGFDMFSNLVRSGDFDRVLLRPRGTVLQVLCSDIEFTRFGKLAVSVSVLVYSIGNIAITWSALRIVTLALMLVCGVFIFSGLFMIGAAMCFWTVEGLEVINIFTYGGNQLASYPLTIYSKWMRRFFTFIIPFGCFNYLPLMYLTGRADNPLYAFTPLLGAAFLAPCLFVWRIGVRRYLSTGN
jgi:ABC-2 type transport system permease protein